MADVTTHASGRADNGVAIAAFILGIVSLVPLWGLFAAPFGLVLGVVGRRRAERGAPYGSLATAGAILSGVALTLWLVLYLMLLEVGGPF